MKRRTLLTGSIPLSLAGCMRLQSVDDSDNSANPTDGDLEGSTGSDANGVPENEEANSDSNTGNGDTADSADNTEDREKLEYPRGVSEDGLSPILATIHHQQLRTRPHTVTLLRENINTGWKTEHTISSDEERVHLVLNAGGREMYFEDDTVWWNVRRAEAIGITGPTYGRMDVSTNELPYRLRGDKVTFGHELTGFIRGGSYDSPQLDDAEPPLITVGGDDVDAGETVARLFADAGDRVTGLDVTFKIDLDGVIRSMNGQFYAPNQSGEEQLLTANLTVNELDKTTVSEPKWMGTAREEATQFDVSLQDENTTVSLTHRSGAPVPAGASASIRSSTGEEFRSRIDQEINPGETLRLWIENDELRWSTDDTSGTQGTTLSNSWVGFTLGGAPYIQTQL